jgi:PAS domain S-box-containing protein
MLNLLKVMTNRKKNPIKLQDKIIEVLNNITDNSEINKDEVSDLIKELQNNNSQFTFDSDKTLSEGLKNKEIDPLIHESNLKSFIDNKKEAIWSIDKEYRIVIVNDFFKEQFFKAYGFELEPGTNALKILSPELADLWKGKFDLALSGENVVFEFSEKIVKKVVFYQVSLYPISSDGKISGVSVSAIDITIRKEEEKALKESEEKYKEIAESTIDIIFLVDIKGKILFINKSMESVLGYKVEEVINKSFRKFVPKKEIPSYLIELVKVFRKEEVKNFITQIYHKEGHLVDVEINGKLIKYEGEYAGQGTIKDIYEKILIDKVIRESEENYRGIFNSVSDAICIQDKNGVIIDVNAGAEKMYGYKREFFVGKTPEFISAPGSNEYDKIKKATVDAYNGKEQKIEFVGLRKNGEEFPKYVSLYQGKYFNEKVVIGVTQDISERKKIENIIAKSEAKYRSIFENNKMIMLLLDPKSKKIVDANPGAEKFYGWTRDELKKMKITHIEKLTPHQVKERIKMVTNSKSNYFEFEHTKKDNSVCDVSVIKGDININDKKLFYILVTDITEQKKAREEIRKSEEKYLDIFNNVPVGIVYVDNEGFIRAVNHSLIKMAGLKEKEFIGKNATSLLKKFLVSKDIPKILLSIKNALLGKKVDVIEFEINNRILESRVSTSKLYNGFTTVLSDVTEQKKYEDDIKASETKFKNLIHFAPDPFFQGNQKGDFIECNEAAILLTGYSRKELLNMNMKSLFNKKMLDRKPLQYDLLNEGKTVQSERKLITKDGKIKLIEMNSKKMEDGTFLSFIRDITERKKSEKALKESEERYRKIVLNLRQAYFETDNIGVITHCTHELSIMSEYSEKELIGKTSFSLVKTEDRERVIAEYKKHLVEKKSYLASEFKVTIKSGNSFWVEQLTNFQYDEKGKLLKASNIVKDISERKESEEALKASESLFRNLSKSTATAIFVYQDEKFVFVNEATEKLSGYSKEELLEMNFWEVVHPEFKEIAYNRGLARQKGEKVTNRYHLKLMKKDGTEAWIDFTGGNINWAGKDAAIGSAFCITDLKMAEEKLIQSEERYKIITSSTSDYLFSAQITKDGKSKMDWVAGSFKKISGYTLKEFQKRGGWTSTIHPKDAKIENVALEKLKNNKKVEIEVRIFNKNDEIVWVRYSTSPVWSSEENRVVSIFGAVKDITEEKKANLALKKSGERYKLITNLTSDYLFAVNIDKKGRSNPTWIAGSFEEITGYTFEEYKERGGWVATVHPDDLEKDKTAFEKLKRNEKAVVEIRTIHKSGKIVWVETYGSPVWDKKKNKLKGINGAVRDITMEKLAFIALHESEEKYKLISSLTSDYLFESKYNEQNVLEIIWVAGSFEIMTGYTLEEYKAVGGWSSRLHKDDVAVDNEALKKLHQNKKAFLEVRTYHKNGDIIWVRNSCSPIWDPIKKRVIGITGAVTNITEEKRQQLIRQIQYNISNDMVNVKSTNKLFSIVRTELLQLIDASNFFVAFYDEDKGLLTTAVDYDKDKVISWEAEKSITGIVIEENKKIFFHKEEILSLAKSKKIKLVGEVPEVWLGVPLHISGKVFGAIVLQSYNNPDAYDKSSIELLEVIASQLSLFIERNKAENDALRLSRAIVQSPVSVVITNMDGDIEYVNPMFEKVSGYAFEEVFGENSRILNAKEQPKEFYKELWDTILSGKDWHGEFHNKKKNGELYWENAIISPIENEKEEITHFVAIKEDITEKKKMLGEIIISKEQAVASEKIKTEFLAQMSHEIRSPLNVIMSFIELIKGELSGSLTSDMEDSFQSIDSASSRIIRTIDLILNMTDLQLGSYVISLVDIDVVSMLQRVKSEYLKSAHNKGLELRLELEFNRKKITSDEYALIQIVSNLVDNAIKYTDTGYVSIVAKKDAKNGLIIKVNDTGIGMKKEFLPIIFSSFTQEEQGYSRTFDGNGLGMALVKNYCEVISADISVQSKKGKGTTFTLEIPNLK